MTKPNWKPIQIRLGDLVPWGDNPKYSTKEDARRLIETEQEFGQPQTFSVSPYIDGSKVNCYDGHQRDSAWRTAYGDDFLVWAMQSDRHLTEPERRKFVLRMHNAHGQWSSDLLAGWGADELKGGWFDNNTLKTWKADVTWLGEFLKSEAPAVDAEPQTDRAAELLEKWQVKPGDLWLLGDHKLICGDCTDTATVARVMDGERVKIIWSDPPFGISYDGHGSSIDGDANKFEPIANDDIILSGWIELVSADAVYLKTTWKTLHDWESQLSTFGDIKARIVWDKCSHVAGDVVGGYATQSEIILYAVSSRDGKINKFDTDVWRIERATTGAPELRTGHPFESPIALPSRAIGNNTDENDIVYDPFTGSGTCLVACENLRRRCRAVEISPAYVAVALERMSTAFPGIDIRRAE